ncbi:MAG: molybdopterin oxidoreductase, partial [Massilia sp.]|nr:molybdopterin oxidoreductase [Massilia sp.]
LGFLPALSRRLLGQPLAMPSVATWWCGEPDALDTVIANLDRLVIKPAFPQLPQAAVFGQDLHGDARADLIAALRANPGNFIAQELVKLSQAPVWQDQQSGAASTMQPGLQARAIGLRVFACATPNGYVVMPGGLTRVATGPDARVLTMQRGGASKDTWVQARARAALQHPRKRSMSGADLVREDSKLSSRVAENLLWFGRHAERCDNIGRLLRVALNFLFNVRFDQRGAEWPTVMALCGRFQLIDIEGVAADADSLDDDRIETALLRAVVSPAVPGLARQQRQLHRVAGQLHERFSVDNWRALNRMVQSAAAAAETPSQSEVMTILDDAAASLMMLSGFALDGMTRDLGWRFMSIGRRLERLQFQSIVLQRALAMDDDGNLDWLLELSDSIITYRARYRAQPEWLPVLDLLLCDQTNPRSIVFQLDGILGALGKIATTHGACGEQLLAPLRDELVALDPDADFNNGNVTLSSLLHRIELASSALSEHISVRFFSYTDNADNGRRRTRRT